MIIGRDMNAKVVSSNRNREVVMRRHGIGEINRNGEKLVDFCKINNLVVTGTIFPHRDIHKTTWTLPDG